MQNAELETAESLSADACETYGLAFPIKKGYLSVVMSHDCRKLRREDGVFFPILAVIFLAIFFMVLGLGVDAFFVKRAKTELQKDVDALCDSLAVFKDMPINRAVMTRAAAEMDAMSTRGDPATPRGSQYGNVDNNTITVTLAAQPSNPRPFEPGGSAAYIPFFPTTPVPIPVSCTGCVLQYDLDGIAGFPTTTTSFWSNTTHYGKSLACRATRRVNTIISGTPVIEAVAVYQLDQRYAGTAAPGFNPVQGVLVGLDPHMVSGQETGGAITESRFRFDPSDSAYSIIFDFYDPFDGSALGVDNGAFTVGTDLNAPSGALANVATGSNQHEALLMSCMNPLVALRNQFMSGLAMILERHPDTRTKTAYYMLPSRTNAQPASVAALPIVEQRPRTALTYRDPLDRNRSYRVPTASVPVNSAGPELLSVVGNSADAEYWLRRNAQYCYHMYGGSMAERVNPVTGTRVRVGLNPLIDNIGFEPSGVTPRTNFPAPSGIYSWAPVNGMDDGFLASEVFAIVGTVQSDPAALSIGTAYEPWNPASGAPARADSLRADLPAFLNFTINAYVGAGSDLSNPAVILFLVMPPHPAENAAILAAVQQINATGRQVVVVYAPASLRDCAQWSDLAQNAFNVDLSGTGASRNSFLLLAPSDTTDPTNTVYCRCPTSLGFTADDQCMRWYWHRVIANSGIPGNQNSIQGQVLNLVYSDIFEMHKRL